MLLLSWATVAALGRILIFVWQRFPEKYVPTSFLKDVHACDLCSGFWCYGFLSWAVHLNVLQGFGLPYVPVLAEVLTGATLTTLMWIFVAGLQARFGTTMVIR